MTVPPVVPTARRSTVSEAGTTLVAAAIAPGAAARAIGRGRGAQRFARLRMADLRVGCSSEAAWADPTLKSSPVDARTKPKELYRFQSVGRRADEAERLGCFELRPAAAGGWVG